MQVRDACADESWDREVDVVVVGSGGSGLSAAIEAAAAGADTLVLEKAGIVGGTTIRSAGITQAAGTSFQKELTEYQDDTPENHFNWYMALGEGQVDEELVRDLAYGCPEVIRWYTEDLGLTIYGLSLIHISVGPIPPLGQPRWVIPVQRGRGYPHLTDSIVRLGTDTV